MPIICPEFLLLQLRSQHSCCWNLSKYFTTKNILVSLFGAGGRWEVALGVETCFINWLEYMGHNVRLHFIRTLILTFPWKLYMRINISPGRWESAKPVLPSWTEYIWCLFIAQSVSVNILLAIATIAVIWL